MLYMEISRVSKRLLALVMFSLSTQLHEDIYFHQAKYQFSFLKQNNLNILAELAARKAKTHTYIEWLFMENFRC